MTDVDFVATLSKQLRERNRAYGKASAEIGRLRGVEARLQLERAQDRAASPGAVNGDVLAEVLRAAAPDRWTNEARTEFAEQVLRDMLPSGFRIYRGPNHEPWSAAAPEKTVAPPPRHASLPPFPFVEGTRIVWYQGNVERTITSVRPNETAEYGVEIFVDEGRLTQMGPIVIDEWQPAPPVFTEGQLDEVRRVSAWHAERVEGGAR